MRSCLFLLSAAVSLFAITGIAEAQNIGCYDWDCNETTHECSFDASCTQITDGELWRYRWDFGDGSGVELTGNPVITHQYSNQSWANVQLTAVLFGSDDWPDVTCEVLIFNAVGPPQLTSGRCSE